MPFSSPFASLRPLRILPSIALAATMLALAAWANGPRHPGRYIPPAASYVIDPTETAINLDFGNVQLDTIQQRLDAARTANPDPPIILTQTGSYWVRTTPLTLPSKTSLVLYGTIAALPNATATSLVSISGPEQGRHRRRHS